MKRLSLSLALLLSAAPVALHAQDRHNGRVLQADAIHAPAIGANSHSGSSPFPPPDEDDTLFVVDTGSGLDTGCTFRSGGPFMIHLKVKRVVGPINGDGTLQNPGDLISRGLVSPTAHLRLPAFDVDVNGAPGFPPEVDRLFFNGHDLGTLTGDNNIWKLNEFDVPIDWVKFPAQAAAGSQPSPADNILQLNIDEASAPDENWCTSIDWAEIEFKAVAPIFLVHGTNAQSDTWNPHFTAFFQTSGAPWSNDINLQKNGGILANGGLLATRVQQLADSFGAKKCHIIAHSKGGLDTRAYLNNQYDEKKLKVLSVYTLSTPHHGTIVSDIIVAGRAAKNPESPNADIKYLIDHDYSFVSTPQPPAIGDQTTVSMARFNSAFPSVPGGILFYNYGADADLNHDGRIQANETNELFPGILPNNMAAAAGTAMYRAIGNISSIRVTVGTRPGRLWGTNTYTAITVASTNNPFAINDLVTSVPSAHSPGGNYLATQAANHSSMKTTALAQTILQHIVADFPNH
jgi:pimeloyl-ACP methyl ester carboxylesterase